MAKRRICFVTGARAEYGLLQWVLHEIKEDPDLELQIIATGMHLSPEFGLTYQAIEEDGFEIDEKVEMLLSSETSTGVAKSMGLGTVGIAEAFDRLAPDVALIPCDRYEALAAAQVALVKRIPIAHVYGGETTEGAIDEAIRHSLTKMALLHYVSAEPHRERVIQLGEEPERVKNFGAPQLDHLNRLDLLDRHAFEDSIGFKLGDPTFLITYHPTTLRETPVEKEVSELLEALDHFSKARLIFTKSNADTGGQTINKMIEDYAEGNPERARVYSSLGQRRYLSASHHVDAVVGNSSSGLIEAPAIPVPTVNIGDRQKGRLRAESVIDCKTDSRSIVDAIEKALSSPFQTTLEGVSSPYGEGNAAPQICEHLKEAEIGDLAKSFYDLPVSDKIYR
ncbi:UDP-N-acetylglucosamine 2-epimerase [Salinibacter ruber]|uniref:UDP-N-acetylglucosamine 2-epimerase (Non-hydrolyzing)/GDP/UDP-N,N'-diacetylbacillosamine 2-epimerase (Hydrolyzing) n=1 Tax=Salinibacter ruber TaxID=146919 RepID=A0A9X2V8Q6_9BACT|nr:UDP-N-acetylglucosamine 2-epimerase [Salinibacter ruber]MCS4122748.1 UDP-N-acetylglucosamine 2-epimerase (non-hydrolyzing)/GDP/UDP-N,N'-diacetylbacillosamine 2-epimerase (hydrolyzing) [Salinibacter ruber]